MAEIPEKKFTFLEKKLIIDMLGCITDKEWIDVINRCKNAIKHRIRYADYGAHSEAELCMPALDYYINEAITKIYLFDWYWDIENIRLEKHMITIANSLISRQVDSYKRKKDKKKAIIYNDELDYDLFEDIYDERVDQLIECIERITADDFDLNFYWEAIKESKKPKEIAELMDIDVRKVYKKNDKLIYQARTKCLSN
ncbi:MAG TPA: hypothetical protein VFC65_18150 [Prolixibacteraceae bacterium]|nr:hypothetical protein [Prolixibacteraceae bacterium]